jgi:hypothetical protein
VVGVVDDDGDCGYPLLLPKLAPATEPVYPDTSEVEILSSTPLFSIRPNESPRSTLTEGTKETEAKSVGEDNVDVAEARDVEDFDFPRDFKFNSGGWGCCADFLKSEVSENLEGA